MSWKVLRALVVLVSAILTPIGPTPASNLGYWYRLGLPVDGATSGTFWLAVPSLYTPPDANGNLLLDAEDLAQDLQPLGLPRPCTQAASDCAVAEVAGWDKTTGSFVTWTGGGTGTPFELVAGRAYRVTLQAVAGHDDHALDLAGADDQALGFDDCHRPDNVNLRWISLPPNLDVDVSFGVPDVLDAEDLGQAMGGPDHVFQLRRLDEATGLYEGWVVGSVYGTPFEVDLSRAVGVDLSCTDLAAPCEDCPWLWSPPRR